MTAERARFIEDEVARLKRAGCQAELRRGPCGYPVHVEVVTTHFATFAEVACENEETHNEVVRI